MTLTGGPYAYVGTTLGPYAGFISGVLLWMIGVFATAAVSSVMAASIGELRAGVGRQGDASCDSRRRVRLLVAAVNMRGVTLGVRLNTAITVAKLLPLLLIAIAGVFFVRAENLQVAEWPGGRRLRAHVARPGLRVRGHRSGADPQRRSARHRTHRAESHRAGDGRRHHPLHRAAGRGAGHSRRGAAAISRAARRCRRRVTRRVGAIAAAGRRRDLDVRLSRWHDAVDPADRLRARA